MSCASENSECRVGNQLQELKNNKKPKSNAQRCKEYRERQKKTKENELRKKNAQKCREYRERLKLTSNKSCAEYKRDYRRRVKLKKQSIQLNASEAQQDHSEAPQDKSNSQRKIHECSEEVIENNLFQAQDQHLSNGAQTLVATYDRDTDIPTHGRSNPYTSYAPTLLEMDMNESSSSEPVDVKPFIHSPWFALNASQSPVLDHKPPSLQNDDSSSSTAFMPDENSSFFQFFRGIHSEYLELNARKQRRFKRKCLDFLHELLDEDDSNHQMQSYSHQENVLNLSNSHVSEEEKDVKPVVDVDGYILPTNG